MAAGVNHDRGARGIDSAGWLSHNWEKPKKSGGPEARKRLISRRAISVLVTLACVLPVAIVVLVAAGWLLAAMQDEAAGRVLQRIALAFGLAWLVDLVVLVIAQGINSLGPPDG